MTFIATRGGNYNVHKAEYKMPLKVTFNGIYCHKRG